MDCTCCRCGKIFDYEKYYGICPKCAAYNQKPGHVQDNYNVDGDFTAVFEKPQDTHEKLHEMYDSTPAHQPQEQHAQYHRQYDSTPIHQPVQRKAEKKRSSKSSLARFFLVLTVLIVILMIVYIVNADKINAYLKERHQTEMVTKQVQAGSEFGNSESTITVDYGMVVSDSRTDGHLPVNEQLIVVHMTVRDENRDFDKKISDPPLVYCNGIYREALYNGDIEDYLKWTSCDIDKEELLNRYSGMRSDGEGYFFYLIPNAEENVTVVVQEAQKVDSKVIAVQYLIDIALMPLSENENGTEDEGGFNAEEE